MKKLQHGLLAITIIALSSLHIFAGCTQPQEPTARKTLTLILHAGGAADGITYLNAQETFEGYYNQGYRYFEYDLMLSSDGRLIGSHEGQHLNCTPETLTYEEFKSLKLPNGFTPATEEWLMETIMAHPDVTIVVDAKMPDTAGDVAVLNRIEALESIYNYDLSANILPEIFSKEMWEAASVSTTFDRYFFSHYKVYYSIEVMLEYFSDDRIWGIALPIWSDNYITSNAHRLKAAEKKLFFFTPTNGEEVARAVSLGADGIYADSPTVLNSTP